MLKQSAKERFPRTLNLWKRWVRGMDKTGSKDGASRSEMVWEPSILHCFRLRSSSYFTLISQASDINCSPAGVAMTPVGAR